MHQTLKLILVIALAALGGCSEAPPLLNQHELASKYQRAATKVAAVIVAEKEDPREFKAEVEEKKGGRVYVFHLWHRSALPPNRLVIGNPGGKCRDIEYEPSTGKASRSLFWQ